MNWRTWLHPQQVANLAAKPRVRKTGWTLLGLFVVFCLAAFFAGPPLLKSYLADTLSQQLGRTVSVGKIHINPLMLSVTIDDFMLAEADGKTPFVAFKQAYVNAQLASLAMGGPVLSEIQLTQPRVHLVRSADERYNFQDMLDRLAPPAAKPAQKTESKPLRFSLNNIRITDGAVEFDDRPMGRVHTVRQINARFPFSPICFIASTTMCSRRSRRW